MQQVIAADRQAVAVTGYDPDVEVGVGELEPGCECRSAAVNRMEAIGIDVVGKSGCAADAGDEGRRLGCRADVRERLASLDG